MIRGDTDYIDIINDLQLNEEDEDETEDDEIDEDGEEALSELTESDGRDND